MDKMTFTECDRIGFGMLKKTGRVKNVIAPGAAAGAEYLIFLLRDDEHADQDACFNPQTFQVYPYGRENSETCWILG